MIHQKIFLSTLVIIFLTCSLSAQVEDFNIDSVGNLDYDAGVNDIWGYVDSEGTEYAIMGTEEGTAVISLEDPSDPVEVYYVPGAHSNWRDMKTYGDYAYSIADQGNDGLLVIDLSRAENDSFSHSFYTPELQVNNSTDILSDCHNVYIDDAGYAYLTGCNLNSGGTLIFDLSTDPMEPEFVGNTPAVYAHDCYARGDRLYTADIFAGNFSVYDISDKSDPQLLARQSTTFNFTHNLWSSDDGQYLFTTDERANAYVDAYDISDLDNIQRLDVFRPESTVGEGVIPHNTYFFNDYLVTSWYTDGLKIIDAHQADNLVEVGSYDTYDGPNGGFSGCWGAYPYLPSGLILASDRRTGLYVLDPDYRRASYLEGLVIDSSDGEAIPEATITVPVMNTTRATTDTDGEFSAGVVEEGTFSVVVDHPFYVPDTVDVNLERAETKTITVELSPLYDSYTLDGRVEDQFSGNGIAGAILAFNGTITSYQSTTDNGGQFQVNIFEDTYDITSGEWGYREAQQSYELSENGSLTIPLTRGYKDDFVLDLGWTVEGDAVSGNWERTIPSGLFYGGEIAIPPADIDNDLGVKCYVTGADDENIGSQDVDNGSTHLVSPLISLDTIEQPMLSYAYWFFNAGGFGGIAPDDTLEVSFRTDNRDIPLKSYVDNDTINKWRFDTIDLREQLDGVSSGRVVFSTSDLISTGHIVEAAVDIVRFFDADTTTAITSPFVDASPIRIYPNPAEEQINISSNNINLSKMQGNYRVLDVEGKNILEGHWSGNPIDVATLPAGTYFILFTSGKDTRYRGKFIKQ